MPDRAQPELHAPPSRSVIRRDLERFFRFEARARPPGVGERLRIVLETPGLHAVLVYRLGAWLRGVRSPLVRVPLRIVHALLARLCAPLYGIELAPSARIGPGLTSRH